MRQDLALAAAAVGGEEGLCAFQAGLASAALRMRQ